jgi:AcrR family transcriptional regulator
MTFCQKMNNETHAPTGTKRQRTRDQLLVAAQEILIEQGAAGLGIKDIAHRASMVHATFYNYYDSVAALLDDLGDLFMVTHGLAVRRAVAGIEDPARVFTLTTRLLLEFFARSRGYGTVLFDSGLPIDRFVQRLRVPLRMDIEAGKAAGQFAFADPDIAVSLVTGAVLGLALDLHRGRIAADRVAPATADLLVFLGLDRSEAERLAGEFTDIPEPPELPLRWMAIAEA